MAPKEFYRIVIAEAIEACTDIELLDLVWRIFIEEGKHEQNN